MSEMLRDIVRKQEGVRVPSVFELNPEESAALKEIIRTVVEPEDLIGRVGEGSEISPVETALLTLGMAAGVPDLEKWVAASLEKNFGQKVPESLRKKREALLIRASGGMSEEDYDKLVSDIGLEGDDYAEQLRGTNRSVREFKMKEAGVPPIGQVDAPKEVLPDLPQDRIEDIDVIDEPKAKPKRKLPPTPEQGAAPSGGIFSSGKSVEDYINERAPKKSSSLVEFAKSADDAELLDSEVPDVPVSSTKSAARKAVDVGEDIVEEGGRFGKIAKYLWENKGKSIFPLALAGGLAWLASGNKGVAPEEKKEEPKPEPTPRPQPTRRQQPRRVDPTQQKLEQIYMQLDEIGKRYRR